MTLVAWQRTMDERVVLGPKGGAELRIVRSST
jgi:hypothetical protein